jgi:hypothetical protein
LDAGCEANDTILKKLIVTKPLEEGHRVVAPVKKKKSNSG